MNGKKTVLGVCAWCAAMSAGTAWAQESYSAQGSVLSVSVDGEEIASVPMPCTIEGEVVRADVPRPVVLARCGDIGGLLVVDVTNPADPQALEVRAVEGGLERVFLVGGKPWVQTKAGGASVFTMAIPVKEAPVAGAGAVKEEPPGPPTEPGPPVEPPPETDETAEPAEPVEVPDGQVLSVEGREVVIDRGKKDGVREGYVVRFYEKGDLDGEVPNSTPMAAGVVTAVAEARATVRMDLNTRAQEGAIARTSREFFRQTTPPRVAGVSEYIVNVRPGVPLGELGVFMVSDALFVHRFEIPMAVEVGLSPLGLGATTEGSAATVAAHAILSYDHQLFQVGLGGGVASAGVQPDAPLEIDSLDEAPDGGIAPVLLLYGRLGSRDALNLTLRTSLLGLSTGFELGGFDGQIMAPVPSIIEDAWLVARGSFQTTGYGYGELGLRMLLAGTGHKGSFFVTPVIGGAAISQTVYERDFSGDGFFRTTRVLGGPMVGVSLEWRE
jgi:hypothetical protein